MAKEFEAKVLKSLDKIQGNINRLQTDVRRLEVLHEETADKIDQIIEVVSPELQRSTTQDERLNNHETCIVMLEKSAA